MRKKNVICIAILFVVLLSGCNSFAIQGLDKFNENDCCFGLTDALLPGDRSFLSNYNYKNGNYQYWRNNYGPVQAKAFVSLEYSQDIYKQAKAACMDYYETMGPYYYDEYTFQAVNIGGGEPYTTVGFPGLRMFGYNDNACALIFIGYIDDSEDAESISESNFAEFINEHFRDYLYGEEQAG